MRRTAIAVQAVGQAFPEKIQSGGMNGQGLLGHLVAARVNVGHFARVALSNGLPTTIKKHEVGLVRCSLRDLGFKEKPVRHEVWNCIKEIGVLCLAEDGPHLRYQFTGQPIGDHFWVATDPISVGFGGKGIFYLYRSNSREVGIELCPVGDDVRLDLNIETIFRSKK